jgi:hypothetical protein
MTPKGDTRAGFDRQAFFNLIRWWEQAAQLEWDGVPISEMEQWPEQQLIDYAFEILTLTGPAEKPLQ